jgi:two-component system OmpR family sensor kinase
VRERPSLGAFRSIRWRLTLWYSGMLALLLALFAAGSLVVLAHVLAARSDHFLQEARGAYLVELVVEYEELGTVEAAAKAAVRDTRFRDTWVFVFDAAGRLLARGDVPDGHGSWRHAVFPPDSVTATARRLALSAGMEPTFATIAEEQGGYRALAEATSLAGQRLVVVAVQTRHAVTETVEQVAAGYFVVIPLLLVVAMAGGYLLARRSLAPMAEMTRRTRAIGATNLNERLSAHDPHDEVGQLAGVVNDLLARLETAMANQRRFVADASHELRTPVATVWAEADVALGAETRSEPEYRESLRVVRDAGRRLSRVVEDLFLLARIDAGHLPVAREPLYMDELVTDVARSLRALAQSRGVRIEVAPALEAPCVGDEALLERLLLNLLDNAIKHSPANGVVRVRLWRADGAYHLAVSDEGPGVPADARGRIFDRFFRVDPSRSRADRTATGGAGLGLAIARWVAEAHGGTLVYDATNGASESAGGTFVATLPVHAATTGAPLSLQG